MCLCQSGQSILLATIFAAKLSPNRQANCHVRTIEAAIFILRIGKYRGHLSDGCEDSRKIQRKQSNTGGIPIAVMRVKRQ